MSSILETAINGGNWPEADTASQIRVGTIEESRLDLETVNLTQELAKGKCEDHTVILVSAAKIALHGGNSGQEISGLLQEKVRESLGCTACSVAKSGDNPIEGYEMSNKRFCARCECAVAYDHRCVPKLQYTVA